MRQYLILSIILTIALTACSSVNPVTDTPTIPLPVTQTITQTNTPSATATVRKTSTHFLTKTAAPSPPSPTPSAFPTLGFDLPAACNKIDPAIDPGLYKEYNLAYGTCGYPSRSPDGSLLAYVTLVPTVTVGNRPDAIPIVQLYSFATKETSSIYQAHCVFLKLRWASTGQLVILDSPYDIGCGYTAVYEPAQSKIIAMLDGIAFDHGNWADDDSVE